LRLPATVRSTSGLRRRSTLQPRLQLDLRLASATDSPAPPSNSTSDSHRLSDPSASPQTGLQLAPSTNLPAQPSGRPSTRVSDRRSGSAFQPTCGLRRLPITRLRLPTELQLSPSINLPAQPSSQPSTCVFRSAFGSAFKPNLRLSSAAVSFGAAIRLTFDLRRRLTFRPCVLGTTSDSLRLLASLWRCPPTDLRLAPPINLPALPADSTPDSSAVRSLRRCRPANLRLASPINLPALPVDPTSDLPVAAFSGAALRPTLDSRLRSTFGLSPG